MPPAWPCSLWRDQKDTKVFAVCAGPPDSAQVLVMAADSMEQADQWVCAIAGRLYLNELQLEEEMVPEYIAIYYLFDTSDGKGGISLDELQAASEGLGNPRSEHGNLTEALKATLTRLQIKADAQGLLSLPQFLKVRALHVTACASRRGCCSHLAAISPYLPQVLKEGLLQPSASGEDLLMQAFRLLDEDGTGSISREALAAWLKMCMCMCLATMHLPVLETVLVHRMPKRGCGALMAPASCGACPWPIPPDPVAPGACRHCARN